MVEENRRIQLSVPAQGIEEDLSLDDAVVELFRQEKNSLFSNLEDLYRRKLVLAGIPRMTPKLGQMFAVFRPSGKIEASFGQLPSPRTARTVVEGLIWPFSLAFGRTPPIGSC